MNAKRHLIQGVEAREAFSAPAIIAIEVAQLSSSLPLPDDRAHQTDLAYPNVALDKNLWHT